MNRDVKLWTRTWLKCQASKVTHHIHSFSGTFTLVSTGFEHVHIDIVCPLHFSRGYIYLLTCMDHFTRWSVTTPLADITDAVARAFVETWLSRLSVPLSLMSDNSGQFKAQVWSCVMTAWHLPLQDLEPQANCMVERFHHQLKSSLAFSSSCHE